MRVPEGWRETTLASIAEHVTKKWEPVDGGEHSYLGLEHLEQGTGRILKTNGSDDLSSLKTKFQAGDVLFGKLRPNLRKTAHPKFDGICSTDIIAVRAKPFIDPAYLFYTLNRSDTFNHAIKSAAGTKMPRTSWKLMGEFRFCLPPLPEQRRIAEILSSVDEAIAATQALIEQTRVVKQGALKRLLTKGIGHTRFKQTEIGELPEGWEALTLQDLCAKITDGSHQTVKTTDSGVPFLYVSCIRDGQIVWEKAGAVDPAIYKTISKGREARKGCVLYTAVGSYGHAVALDKDYDLSFQRHIAYLKPIKERLLPEYLSEFLNSEIGRRYADSVAVGNAQKTVTLKKIKEQILAVPPISEQVSFINKLSHFNESIRLGEKKNALLRTTKAALLSALLTGRKRVSFAEETAAE
ncbi:restriction endonuclease subunit S [Rhodospirillum sp. A1_3_36]|uniref:restriction endonuclease subunit S n=1 Tax=Rhodospirillum sp. A1_3_36 TaxID=3391666 RepID=UPI0039A646FB